MGEWLDIENAMVTALAGLTMSGNPMFAMVKGQSWRDRKVLAAAIGRERMPAAYVMAAGRDAGNREYRRAGDVLVNVWYASRSDRSDEEARRGGTDVAGMFSVCEAGAAALQDLELGNNRRLLLVEERPMGGEAGTVLWEQRFEARRTSGEFRSTYGGYQLIGESSEVLVEIGSISRAASGFAFPGVNGVFERFTGTRERPIIWRGQLRAADDAGLNEIEDGLEDLIRRGEVSSIVDPWGRTFESCVVKRFSRKGPRGNDDTTGEALQDFELEFTQLTA